MSRIADSFSFLVDFHRRILVGTWHVIRSGWGRGRHSRPCIVEFPLRCTSDVEIALFASAVTVPPGTIVVGIAAGRGEESPSMFVHSAFDNDRARVLRQLREQERKLLLALRGAPR